MILRAALVLALACSCAAPASAPPPLGRFERTAPGMGTEFRIVLYAAEEECAERAFDAAFARIEALEARLSDYRDDSELSRLSARSSEGAPTPPIEVSEELWTVLERAERVSRESGGAFDVTVGPLVRLWRRAGRRGELPDEAALERAKRSVGHEELELDPATRSVRLLAPDMRLDLGGIAKGYALDEALRVLAELGIDSALVDGGGDIAVGAAPLGAEGWRLALQGAGEDVAPAVLVLERAAVATSGDAYRHVDVGGVRYSHIVDPATGLGLTDRVTVSVVARDATTADACASAACVMGLERGLEWIEARPGLEARFTRLENGAVRACQSEGLARMMQALLSRIEDPEPAEAPCPNPKSLPPVPPVVSS